MDYKQKLTVIFFDVTGKAYKYRNIYRGKIPALEQFLRGERWHNPKVTRLNYYDQKTKQFLFQHTLN